MTDNVLFVVCPKCFSLHAAVWHPLGKRSYEVTCSVCGWEHERGHYESVRNLTLEEFMRDHQAEQAERDFLADDEVLDGGEFDQAHMEMLKRIYGEYWE